VLSLKRRSPDPLAKSSQLAWLAADDGDVDDDDAHFSQRQQCDFAFREILLLLLVLPVLMWLLQFHWKSADDVAGARGVCAMQFAISLAQNGDRIVTVCNYFDLFFVRPSGSACAGTNQN